MAPVGARSILTVRASAFLGTVVAAVLLGTVVPAFAQYLGSSLPPKRSGHLHGRPVYQPEPTSGSDDAAAARVGGEDITTALPIFALPFVDEGNTCGFLHDYDAICPYGGSTSPEVVYSYAVPEDLLLTVDLCGSGYDTKVYVLDESENVLACNDDAYFGPPCGVYVSKIEDAFMAGGQTVYIVIDGYGEACGEYTMEVSSAPPPPPCVLECPAGGWPEGEPPLMDGYVDTWNGGCSSPDYGTPFQTLEGTGDNHLVFCGVSGWYDNGWRDTDWFTAVVDPDGSGVMECTIDAERGTYLFQFGRDCVTEPIIQLAQVVGGCNPVGMTVLQDPGDLVWLAVFPDSFYPPQDFIGHEYDYVLILDGVADGAVATTPAAWSEVKSLYR